MPDAPPTTDGPAAQPARAIAGPSLVLIGAGHTALGALAYRESLAALLRGGVGSAGEGEWSPTETAARQGAFWFEVSGAALVLLGDAVGRRSAAASGRRAGWGGRWERFPCSAARPCPGPGSGPCSSRPPSWPGAADGDGSPGSTHRNRSGTTRVTPARRSGVGSPGTTSTSELR